MMNTDSTRTKVIPIRTPKPWTQEDFERKVAKPMDELAAAFRARDPQAYENWREQMFLLARCMLRLYRLHKRHPMSPAEFRAHMLDNYETAVVNEVYEDLGMGPQLIRELVQDEKINLHARRQQS